MALTDDQINDVWHGMLDRDPSLSTFLTKIDLHDTVAAADAWLTQATADGLVGQLTGAMPDAWKDNASDVQQNALMAALVAERFTIDPEGH